MWRYLSDGLGIVLLQNMIARPVQSADIFFCHMSAAFKVLPNGGDIIPRNEVDR